MNPSPMERPENQPAVRAWLSQHAPWLSRLETDLKGFPPESDTYQLLIELKAEAIARALVDRMQRWEEFGNYIEAQKFFPWLRQTLATLVSYGSELEAVLPDLVAWERRLTEKAKAQERLQQWEKETGPAAAAGRPIYREYLQAVRLGDALAGHVWAATGDDQFKARLDFFHLANNFYRLQAYAQTDPEFWPDAVHAAHLLLAHPDGSTLSAETNSCLREADKQLDYFLSLAEVTNSSHALNLAERIYQALRLSGQPAEVR